MSKEKLTSEDLKIIESQQNYSPIVRFLRSKDNFNFNVGDYLIKLHKRNNKWEPETVSSVNREPKRFICIHEDEYGIKYIKPLTSMGKELPYITQVTEINDWTKYEVDPEFAEHIILNGEGDFNFASKTKEHKVRRNAITRKNKKISKKLYSLLDTENFILNLPIGTKVWIGYSIPEAAEAEPMVFCGCKSEREYYSNNMVMVVTFMANNGDKRTMRLTSLQGHVVFTTEPFRYETI